MTGDELVFHPSRRDRLFVLPRESEKILEAGEDLLAAVEWMCSSGKLVEPFDERNFEPFDSRKEWWQRQSPDESDPEHESLDDLVEAGKQWAKRHDARKLAKKDLKDQFKPGQTATMLYEAFVLEGEYPIEPGYLAVFRIDDDATGLEVGTFSWHKSESSSGSEFVPNEANWARVGKKK